MNETATPPLALSPASLVDAFDYVVFGGTGDLAFRKLLPALYHRERDGQIPGPSRIIATARSPLGGEEYRARATEQAKVHLGADFDPAVWARFAKRLHYVVTNAQSGEGFEDLAALLGQSLDRIRVYYLATAPDLFGPICGHLARVAVVTPRCRVVLEKPIGHDLASAQAINDAVGRVFAEAQIFRIDHYLGKETVQNLLALRFANSMFEPVWNARHIDHIQITVAETVGLEGRGGYYDKSGALRDMVQNHLLQLLCLVAMEPPTSLDKESVRDEKLKALRALVPITDADVHLRTVRGQYASGAIGAQGVAGYLEEPGIDAASDTETFVALRAELANWRWAGMPFYLRTGKRMPMKLSEIIIQFKPVPHSIFGPGAGNMKPNRLIVRLQPDEGIKLQLMAKEPGPGGMRLKAAALNLSFAETFKARLPEAYERLLMDVVRGNPTLFMRRDEIEAAWSWTGPILDAWERMAIKPQPYTAGSWGPAQSIALIERDGRSWIEPPLR